MIIPARDPRIDPQRGDVVRGNGQLRRVMAREGDRVRCESGVYEYRMRRDNRRRVQAERRGGRANSTRPVVIEGAREIRLLLDEIEKRPKVIDVAPVEVTP